MSASAIECSLTLKRIFDVPVARLWRAWTDPAELGRWYVAGPDHIVHFCEADVRVGGKYRVGFGPPGTKPYVETGTYTEVVPTTRLCFEESVSIEGKALHTNLTVIDFRELGAKRSQLILTSIGKRVGGRAKVGRPAWKVLPHFLQPIRDEACHTSVARVGWHVGRFVPSRLRAHRRKCLLRTCRIRAGMGHDAAVGAETSGRRGVIGRTCVGPALDFAQDTCGSARQAGTGDRAAPRATVPWLDTE